MKNSLRAFKISATVTFGLAGLLVNAQDQSVTSSDLSTLFPKGRRAPQGNFTGAAWVYQLIEADSAFNIPVGNVTFEPGARTYWHKHPGGQVLLATGGIGFYQEKGKPIQVLRRGDAVKCPADTPHWHGASPKVGFTQIAITPNTTRGRVTWLGPVTEEEYNGHDK